MVLSLFSRRVMVEAVLVFTAMNLAVAAYPQQKIPDVHYDATPQPAVEAMLKPSLPESQEEKGDITEPLQPANCLDLAQESL